MKSVEKVEKVSKLYQPEKVERLYGHTKSNNRIPIDAMGAIDRKTAREWEKHQGFLSDNRDKQKRILLLAEEVEEGSMYSAGKIRRDQEACA